MSKDYRILSLYDIYGELLTVKQKAFIEHYYCDDLSLGEIAENEGITRQGVREAVKRAEQTLLDLDEKLGIAALSDKTDGLLRSVLELCEQAEQANSAADTAQVADALIKIKAEIIKSGLQR